MSVYRLIFLVYVFIIGLTAAGFARDTSGGQTLYQQYCATCHGGKLQGGNAQSLIDGVWKYGSSDSQIFRNIKFGLSHLGMPSFQSTLSDERIREIIAYLKAEQEKQAATPSRSEYRLETQEYIIRAENWVTGLEIPWAIDFTETRQALITERPGRLRIIRNGQLHPEPIANTPQVLHQGQGGLMDVAVDPEFSQNGWIYLSYSHVLKEKQGEEEAPAMTRIVRGRLRDYTWTDEQVIYEAAAEHYRETRHHYGSRIVFDKKGYLYFSIGDRGERQHAQDLGRPNGKIHRIHRDGTIPADNPFVNTPGALPSVFAYGTRNPQGLAVHPLTDVLWETEHGPMGGDELNRIKSGRNYGWPEITYGLNYDGTVISEFTKKAGMELPVLYWRPSTAVCGMEFYRGDLFPKWENDLLVAALKYEDVRLLDVEDGRVLHQEVILKNHGRVRDVCSGPDGAIYVVLNKPDKVMRLVPVTE
jgi:glucose/arabinose dehydrogenase